MWLQPLIRACDLVIAAAYFGIPLLFLFFLSKENMYIQHQHGIQGRALLRHLAYCIIAFVTACGSTHLWRFIQASQFVQMILALICALISTYTMLFLIVKARLVLQLMDQMELTTSGTPAELNIAFNIIASWVNDMLTVHSSTDFTVQRCSTMCSVYGYTTSDFLNRPFQSFVHEEDHVSVECMFQDALRGINRACMYRLRTEDDCYVMVESTCQTSRWKGCDALFVVTRCVQSRLDYFHQEMAAREEAVRVDTNRNHGMTLAHDLRTSLSVFSMALKEQQQYQQQQQQQQQPVNTSLASALSAAEQALWYMNFIIERTIDSCRVLQGESPLPVYKTMQVEPTLRQVLQMLATYPKSVQAVLDIDDNCVTTVKCDPQWVQSMLTTLLTNAFDNTVFGEITVHVSSTDKRLRIEVIDTGVGVTVHDVHKLYHPFVKLSNKVYRAHGTGIGLYDCAWRARLLGGTYGVLENAGGGSVFYFSLPLRSAFEEAADSVVTVRRTSSLKPENFADLLSTCKVLVVDDTIVFRKLLVMQMKKRGILTIDEAGDGAEALTKLKTNKYDVVLIDYVMPLLRGDECIQQYKAWKHCDDNVKFIMMSADSLSLDLEKGMITDFLQKPINFTELLSLIVHRRN